MSKTLESPLKTRGIKGFFKNNAFIMAAFFIPMFIMAVSFMTQEVAPFGSRMPIISDAVHQYYPFLREFQTLLKDGVLPFYSWNTGGGSSFLGVVGNYIASPLYLFTYFLPEGHIWLKVYLACTIVVRIGCAGGFMSIFLRKVFKRNDLSLVYFSLMYALCGFIMGYYWNVMWLDTVALLPLVVAGAYSVLKEGKFSLYIVSLALSVICSFYIAFFVCIFVLIFCICYTIINFISLKQSFKNAGKMAGFTIVAFMITAFITIPTYMALSHSDSSADAAGFPLSYAINISYGYEESSFLNTIKAILRTITNLMTVTSPITMDKGEPNIFCGVVSLFLLPFYFTTKKISRKEKAVSLTVVIFFVLSFVFTQLDYIWHGFNTPAMIYYRFSFLLSFVLVALAYRAFCLVDSFGKRAFIASAATLTVYLVAGFVFQRKLSVILTAVAVALLFAGLLLYRKGKLRYRAMSVLLCIFVVCEMGVNAWYGTRIVGSSQGDDFPTQESSVKALTEIAESKSQDEFYRTEFTKPSVLNDGALYSMFGISSFNSMCRSDYSDLFTELGLSASKGNNRYVYIENTPVINLFLNIKYLVSRAETSTEDEATLLPQEAYDTTYLNEVAEVNSSILYENTSYIPMGFMADETLLDYELHPFAMMPYLGQNEFFSLATGIDEDVLVPVKENKISGADLSEMTPREDLENYYLYSRSEDTNEVVEVEYIVPETAGYYGFFRASEKDSLIIQCGDREVEYPNEYSEIMSLGYLEKGEKIKVKLPLAVEKNGKISFNVYRFDNEVFDKGYEKLSRTWMKLDEKTSKGFKGTIDVKEKGLFYTSVLYDEGWKAYVDGKEVEITPVAKTFCAFELSEGEHKIEFVFSPEGLTMGIIVSVAGVVSFVALIIISGRKNKKMFLRK